MESKKRLATCIICPSPITAENDSKEHLIPSAIGGRKKAGGVICKLCNSQSGHKWDAELAKLLNPLSLFFGISRDRGNSPSQVFETVGGEPIRLYHDGHIESAKKPDIQEIKKDDQHQIRIEAPSFKVAKQAIMGLKRRFPNIDIEKFVDELEEQSSYLKNPICMNSLFGGNDAYKSLVKSALVLAVINNINPSCCKNAISYLKNITEEACFGFYYERDVVLNRPANTVFHCIAISGNSENGLLFGYAEYFSIHRVVVCLSDSYSGPDVHAIYAIDPISGKELDINFKIPLMREELQNLYRNEKASLDSVKIAYETAIHIGTKNNFSNELAKVAGLAAEYAIKNCGAAEGEILTKQHMEKSVSLAMEKVMPFLNSHSKILT